MPAYCPISSTEGLASNSESVATSRKASNPYICSTGRIFSLYVLLMPSCGRAQTRDERSEVGSARTPASERHAAEGERAGSVGAAARTVTSWFTFAIAGGRAVGL